MKGIGGSLRVRLVLAAVAVAVVFATIFGLWASWRIKHVEDAAIGAALASRMESARASVNQYGAISASALGPGRDLIQVVGPGGRVVAATGPLSGASALASPTTVGSDPRGVRSSVTLQTPDVDLATLASPIRLRLPGSAVPVDGALIVAVDHEGYAVATTDLAGVLLGGLMLVVVVVAGLAWFLTGRALSNVVALTERAEATRPGSAAAGLPIPRGDAELRRLVSALNRMLARVHESHAAELAFAAEAGHRLRTPLATLRAEAELALLEPDNEQRTEALQRIVGDVDQVASIVDRVLARSQRGEDHVASSVKGDIVEARTRWARHADLVAVELDVRVAISPDLEARRVIDILEPIMDNAVHHTPPSGRITVDVSAFDSGRRIRVDVANTGAPVPPGVVGRLFEAWVSTREGSRAGGLGLWLARETARDQGGEVTLQRSDAERVCFRLELPVVKSSKAARDHQPPGRPQGLRRKADNPDPD